MQMFWIITFIVFAFFAGLLTGLLYAGGTLLKVHTGIVKLSDTIKNHKAAIAAQENRTAAEAEERRWQGTVSKWRE